MALYFGPYFNPSNPEYPVYRSTRFLNVYYRSTIESWVDDKVEELNSIGAIVVNGNEIRLQFSELHEYRQRISRLIFKEILDQNNSAEEWQIHRKVEESATQDDINNALENDVNYALTADNACIVTLQKLLELNCIVFEDDVYGVNFKDH